MCLPVGWNENPLIDLFTVKTTVCYVLAGWSIDLFIVETTVCYVDRLVETKLKLLSKMKTVRDSDWRCNNVIAYWRSKWKWKMNIVWIDGSPNLKA